MQKQLKSQTLSYIPLNDTERFFYSSDIGLISCLLSKNFKLAGLDKTIKNKVLFIVNRKNGLDEAINNYWNFQSPIDAQTLFNQLKRLKNQIFSSD